MSNMYGKDKFHDRQKAVLQKSAQKIENDSGWSQDNFLREYTEEILPASRAELSFDELCVIGEQVEQEAAFSAKEAMRNKIKARRDVERYKATSTDSGKRTPNPFEDSNAVAIESPKNEDTLNTTRKHADAPPTKSAVIKTSKKQSLVETARELKKYIHIISCGGVLYYHNEYYYTQLDSKQLIKLYRQNVDYELNNESSLRGYKDLYDCLVTDPQIECSEPEDEPIYAPLENGILDLMEWKLYPHSPDQITFTCIKAKYDPQAKCQIFEEYLQRVTGGDSLLSERVWMAIGYLLIYPARGKFFIFMKGMLENSIARQRERLDKYIDLCADGIITKQELAERRKGLDAQIAELQSQYENVEQEDERSGTLDMNLIAQKLDEWQKASRNDVDRELINSCVAQITPLTNEEYRWVLDFQLAEVQSGNSATCTLDGFMEMARFTISFEEAKAFKASRNQGIRKNEWHDLTVAVGIRTKT